MKPIITILSALLLMGSCSKETNCNSNNAKLTINRHNTKRGALWHHRISWNNIAPKILNNGIRPQEN